MRVAFSTLLVHLLLGALTACSFYGVLYFLWEGFILPIEDPHSSLPLMAKQHALNQLAYHLMVSFQHSELLSLLFWSWLLLTILSGFGSFMTTHALAGPLYHLHRYFVKDRWRHEPIDIRKSDALTFLTSEINYLRQKKRYDRNLIIEKALDLQTHSPSLPLGEVIHKMREQLPKLEGDEYEKE